MKPRTRKHANYVCFRKLILVLSYMAEGTKQYVYFRCWLGLSALVGRIYLIIVSREGDQARWDVSPLQSVYGHAKKGITYA